MAFGMSPFPLQFGTRGGGVASSEVPSGAIRDRAGNPIRDRAGNYIVVRS